jgi:glutamine amidotransferase
MALAVVDYGGGNLGSLVAALERRGARFEVTADAARVAGADGAIFPGDGAFGATMDALRSRGLDVAIRALVERDRPFLGICVGMQVLFESSTEFGGSQGLGILPGVVSRFEDAPRVPHMGWNKLELLPPPCHPQERPQGASRRTFTYGLTENEYAYFLHSYRVPVGPATVAAATHGERFSAIVAQRNVMGTQFHPEKSRETGARLLDNFLNLTTTMETVS